MTEGPSPDGVRALYGRLFAVARDAIQGRDPAIRLLLAALLADGHVLLEDHPGSGKTTLAKAIGGAIAARDGADSFRRIQFTPDLLPSDITGTIVLAPATGMTRFERGPVFTQVLLADEINRASPKVQAALLEAMAEKQVTIDGTSHPLPPMFFAIATQNPFDAAGTYPLSRAQLDRFLFKIRMTHLDRASELEVLARKHEPPPPVGISIDPDEVVAAREVVRRAVVVAPSIRECVVELAAALRADPRIRHGFSTRAVVDAIPALQAWALIEGRDFVSLQDVKTLAIPLFAHRLEVGVGFGGSEGVVRDHAERVLERHIRRTLAARA